MPATVEKTSRPRLRRSDHAEPGIRRVKHGRGFRCLSPDGEAASDPDVLARIHELVIPPAWQEVWISPYPGGHIQATGIDAAGRKQYLYHSRWRERRDMEKFGDMIELARALPALRDHVDEHMRRGDLSREHVLAAAVRLLDRGFFRIGSEDYLGNTPAVARASYIDPRVFDGFADGEAIDARLVATGRDGDEATAIQGPVEQAVLDLLDR